MTTPLKIALGVLCVLVLIGLIRLIMREPKNNKKPFKDRNPLLQPIADMPLGADIAVVDIDYFNRPIFQYIGDYQRELDGEEMRCFILIANDAVQIGKTYKVSRDHRHNPILEESALLITSDSMISI